MFKSLKKRYVEPTEGDSPNDDLSVRIWGNETDGYTGDMSWRTPYGREYFRRRDDAEVWAQKVLARKRADDRQRAETEVNAVIR